MNFKREDQQNPQNLEYGGSADRPGTNFFGLPIQKWASSQFWSVLER
jgi:hypothetical protein